MANTKEEANEIVRNMLIERLNLAICMADGRAINNARCELRLFERQVAKAKPTEHVAIAFLNHQFSTRK